MFSERIGGKKRIDGKSHQEENGVSAAGSSKSRGQAGKVKATEKVKVTRAQPKIIPLPFLDDETPASGTRGSRKKQKGDDTQKK